MDEERSRIDHHNTERQSRSSSIQPHPQYSTTTIGRRERAKSEERNKSSSRQSIPVPPAAIQQQEEDPSSDSSKSAGKKQHRIRRRLLMGGLIKRKNRSLPDLRADEDEGIPMEPTEDSETDHHPAGPLPVQDVSNASLEKSKLMRKSFIGNHSSASLGRPVVNHMPTNQYSPQNKVPPPPPVRKTSHLMCPSSMQLPADSQITVRADIHHERSNSDLIHHIQDSNLPPYPHVEHVRQPSDEFFPPPPPPQELQMLSSDPCPPSPPPPSFALTVDEVDGPSTGLLAELQRKRKQILGAPVSSTVSQITAAPVSTSTHNPWLQELQNTIQAKKMIPLPAVIQQAQISESNSSTLKSVRTLASRFEQQVSVSPNTTVDVVDHAVTRATQPVQPIVAVAQPTGKPPTGPVSILDRKNKRSIEGGKKKSVTFCDQVILVSTAEDTEQDETYVPNPILQRVLRTAYQQSSATEQQCGLPPPPPQQQQQQMAPPNFGAQYPPSSGGTDEVDRMSSRPPYQRLPSNSQVFQQQQQQHPQQQQHLSSNSKFKCHHNGPSSRRITVWPRVAFAGRNKFRPIISTVPTVSSTCSVFSPKCR